jgi:hypothetical protein
VVADDVLALDLASQVPIASPGFPQLKVDPEVASSLGHDKDSLIVLHPLESKRGLRVADLFAGTRLPLGLVYLLGPDEIDASESLQPQDVLIELVRHSFPARLLRSGGAPHLQQCARLAKLVPVLRFTRPEARIPPSELANRVRRDLAAVGERVFEEGTHPVPIK